MKTNVAETSIGAFHNPENKVIQYSQRTEIAAHIIEQTRKERPCCIASIANHFYKVGREDLAQKGTVSARINEIYTAGGVPGYIFVEVEPRKYKPTDRTPARHFCLVSAKAQVKQLEMFL